jgi:hypothetical protein
MGRRKFCYELKPEMEMMAGLSGCYASEAPSLNQSLLRPGNSFTQRLKFRFNVFVVSFCELADQVIHPFFYLFAPSG